MESAQLAADPATATRRWLSVGSSADADSHRAGAAAATAALTGSEPRLLVVFRTTDHDPAQVLAAINEVSGGVPLAGFYSWSEIARVRGINGLHHQTLVVLAAG